MSDIKSENNEIIETEAVVSETKVGVKEEVKETKKVE